MKIFQIMVVLASVSVAHAEPPPTAKSLPAINVLCFRSFVASTVKQVPGVAIDGEIEAGYRDTPRFQLMTVNGEVLKVITNPSMPAYRNEYGKSRFEINVSMIVDPAKCPPIFAWQMDKDVYAFRANDGLLSITSTLHLGGGGTSTEVLKCK